jgi:hypothetical protein
MEIGLPGNMALNCAVVAPISASASSTDKGLFSQ